jgi:hypothetical protein
MPVAGHHPHISNHSPLHHHLRRPRRLGKIILGNQKVALLSDPSRVAKPGTDHVERELALQFRLPAGCASNGTIVANPRRRRGAGVASSRCVGWHSFNPSPRWLRHGTVESRPRIFRDRYARGLRHLRSRLRRAPSVPTTTGYALLTCHEMPTLGFRRNSGQHESR